VFTIEFEPDAAVITSLDEHDQFEDVEVVIGEDGTVYMRQFNEELNEYQLLYMSFQQYLDIAYALNKTQGMYYVERT
jgi:hypothetical protein